MDLRDACGMETLKRAGGKSEGSVARGRKWSAEERGVMVRASLKKGTTVNAVAQLYGVQPWQIYEWRKQARQAAQQSESATLLPVQLAEATPAAEVEPKQGCSIVIEAQFGRVTITGPIDAMAVRTVLECLAR